MMNERIDQAVKALEGQALQTLQAWLQIPSVEEAGAPDAPFGPDVARMLDRALSDAEALGLTVRNFDHYIGDATWGEGGKVLGVLTHLDIVPAGDGWRVPPFSGLLEDGRVYGRGANDDKGPAVAALYAVRALMDAGVPLDGRVRLIFGCDEESGWSDIRHYKTVETMPDFGFSPDAGYPVINTEKGILHVSVDCEAETGDLLSFQAGQRANVVPGSARARVRAADPEKMRRQVEAFAKTRDWPFILEFSQDEAVLTAIGVTGHAAIPAGTRNAAGMLFLLLRELGLGGPWVDRLAEAIGLETDGASMGIACQDAVSGSLTLNLGVVNLEAGKLSMGIDIRYPVHVSPDALTRTIERRFADLNAWTRATGGNAPLHVPAQSEIVVKLCEVYKRITGGDATPYAIGGGTYARSMDNCVAFGVTYPGTEELAHQANEYVSVAEFNQNIRIFAHAIAALLAPIGSEEGT